MFTDNEDIIREITYGYGVGELYENQKKPQKKIECSKRDTGDKAKILDIGKLDICKLDYDDDGKLIYHDTEATFNFHLYPDDEEIAGGIAKEIRQQRIAVIKAFEKMEESDSIKTLSTKDEFDKEDKIHGKIYISGKSDGKGYGSNGGLKFKNLYRYILAMKNNRKYELNFMRFFISKDNKVHCILKAIQFDRCMDNRNDSGVNYDKGKCRVCYPTSYQSQAARRDKIIEKNSKESLKSFCYNPDVSFYYNSQDEEKTTENARLIAKAFIDFINECDKWNNDNE